jgi:hypothetical protein
MVRRIERAILIAVRLRGQIRHYDRACLVIPLKTKPIQTFSSGQPDRLCNSGSAGGSSQLTRYPFTRQDCGELAGLLLCQNRWGGALATQ